MPHAPIWRMYETTSICHNMWSTEMICSSCAWSPLHLWSMRLWRSSKRQQIPPARELLSLTIASFIALVESAFLDTLPALVHQIQLESCRQRTRESVDDYHTRFLDLVAGCDPKPSEENQAAIFLRNSLLPRMSKQSVTALSI